MQYMIVEKFKKDKIKELYQRFDEKGRMMPEGLTYLNSWISEDLNFCYQLMETNDYQNLNEWIDNWKDLCDFQIIPVISSGEAKERVLNSARF